MLLLEAALSPARENSRTCKMTLFFNYS